MSLSMRPKLLSVLGQCGLLGHQKPGLAYVTDEGFKGSISERCANTREDKMRLQLGFANGKSVAGSFPDVASGATSVSGPMVGRNGSTYDRASFFGNMVLRQHATSGQEKEAETIRDMLIIRGHNCDRLQHYAGILGTALGLKITNGIMSLQPAIVVYVSHKMNKAWVDDEQVLPDKLLGPDGLWCALDVIEFVNSSAPGKTEVYSRLASGVRGGSSLIGPGSQVATATVFGTLGAIVKCRLQNKLGFLTNRHVSVDLDRPVQALYHPVPPQIGPGVILGHVERALSYATDHLWYGIFCSPKPNCFVRADSAFIPFADSVDLGAVITDVAGIGKIGPVFDINLDLPLSSIVGNKVQKVGRTTGLTSGTIMAFAVEHDEEPGTGIYSDFLIVGDGGQFDAEGDSGSMIVMHGKDGSLPHPVGLVWGGTVNFGCLRFETDGQPQSWTAGIGLGRLMDLLEVDLAPPVSERETVSRGPDATILPSLQASVLGKRANLLPLSVDNGNPETGLQLAGKRR